ncbi:hypothetical protein DFQ28_001137 [Apophysomyces sp. BC1034]|nr:hypothetical protein DFQ28_001137 [Apophysomyces sp. BC1034]
MDINTPPPSTAIYASMDGHKNSAGMPPSSGIFTNQDRHTIQSREPFTHSGITNSKQLRPFLDKFRIEGTDQDARLELLREFLDKLRKNVPDQEALAQSLDVLCMTAMSKFPSSDRTGAFAHIFAAALKIQDEGGKKNGKTLQDKMIREFKVYYHQMSTSNFPISYGLSDDSRIDLFDAILARAIESPLKEQQWKMLTKLAKQLRSSEWTRDRNGLRALAGEPYDPRPELETQFDNLLSKIPLLDAVGRAKLSTELAKGLFLLYCLDKKLVLDRYRDLRKWVEALPEIFQAKPRNALGRAIQWLPEEERMAEYRYMLNAAKQLLTDKGEALAGLPEALVNLTATEQDKELKVWKDELIPKLEQASDRKQVGHAFIPVLRNLTSTSTSEVGLSIVLNSLKEMSVENNEDRLLLHELKLNITANSDRGFSSETLGSVLDLLKKSEPTDWKDHLLDLDNWLRLKMLKNRENRLLPIEKRIKDELSELNLQPRFEPITDPLLAALEPWRNDRHATDQSDNNRRHQSIADWIKARLGRQ